MGMFSKKESVSASDAESLGIHPGAWANMSDKDRKKALAARDGGRGLSDLRAGANDFLNGRKSSGGAGPAPVVRKGKSIFAPDSSQGTKAAKRK